MQSSLVTPPICIRVPNKEGCRQVCRGLIDEAKRLSVLKVAQEALEVLHLSCTWFLHVARKQVGSKTDVETGTGNKVADSAKDVGIRENLHIGILN